MTVSRIIWLIAASSHLGFGSNASGGRGGRGALRSSSLSRPEKEKRRHGMAFRESDIVIETTLRKADIETKQSGKTSTRWLRCDLSHTQAEAVRPRGLNGNGWIGIIRKRAYFLAPSTMRGTRDLKRGC